MNGWVVLAAALAVLVAAAHSWLGERYVIAPLLRRPDLPRLLGGDTFTKRTLRFAWHLTSVAWAGLAAVLIAAAPLASQPARAAVGRVVAATFAASSVVALAGSRGRHLSWIVFAAIAAAAWFGLVR